MTGTTLATAAIEAARQAYAPYSRFQVGAALLAADGRVFVGANVENVSFPEGVCAETSAISAMVGAGARKITRVAIFAASERPCTPCGGCRQRLAEFGAAHTVVEIHNTLGLALQTTLGELLPHAFGVELKS